MTAARGDALQRVVLVSFLLFVFCSTFSIALSQLALGIATLSFIVCLILQWCRLEWGELKDVLITAGLFVGWLILSAAVSGTASKSLFAIRDQWLFVVIVVGYYVCRNQRWRAWLVTALAVGTLLLTPYCLIQFLTGEQLLSSRPLFPAGGFGYRTAGFFTLVTFGNFFAVTAAMMITLAAVGRDRMTTWRWYVVLFAGLGAALLTVLSFGRSPLAALGLALVVTVILSGRRYWKITLPALVIIIIAATAIPGVRGRFEADTGRDLGGEYRGGRVYIWNNTVTLIKDHPWTGVGPGNFKTEYAKLLPPDVKEVRKVATAHNDLLNFAAISGLPAVLFYLLLWLVIVRRLWLTYFRSRREHNESGQAYALAALSASVAFFASSMFHGTFVDEEVRQLLMFVWAVGLSAAYNEQADPSGPV